MQVLKFDQEKGTIEPQDVALSERYSPQVIEQLKSGKVVLDYFYNADGTREQSFLQLDEETNEIIGVSSLSVARNIQTVATALHLTSSEETCLQNGSLVTYADEDDDVITIGLDLHSPTGIRFAAGDDKKWQMEKKRDWDKYEMGISGCWMTDDDGNLQYISEDEFEEYDIWNEVEKQHNRKAYTEPVHRSILK